MHLTQSFLGLLLAGLLFSANTQAEPSVGEGQVATTQAAVANGPLKPPYLLKEGDMLEVSVWQEDSLRKELRVLPDGSITFPLVGRVEVAGFTAGDVEVKIATKLMSFLSDPVVNVMIAGINGNRVYVIGNVVKPGPVTLDVPMSVLQVLSLAGGLGRFADENAIKVLREDAHGTLALPVRYSDLIKAKDLSTNVTLRAGDTLLVP
jgi:polysaccharide export outer membrane protein